MQSFPDRGKPENLTISEFADFIKSNGVYSDDTLEYDVIPEGIEVFFMNCIYRMTQHEFDSLKIRTEGVNWVEGSGLAEGLNHLGDREYQTYDSWRRACRMAHPNCTFRGDKDIGGAVVGDRDVGEWGGDVGSVFKQKSPAPAEVVDRLFNDEPRSQWPTRDDISSGNVPGDWPKGSDGKLYRGGYEPR